METRRQLLGLHEDLDVSSAQKPGRSTAPPVISRGRRNGRNGRNASNVFVFYCFLMRFLKRKFGRFWLGSRGTCLAGKPSRGFGASLAFLSCQDEAWVVAVEKGSEVERTQAAEVETSPCCFSSFSSAPGVHSTEDRSHRITDMKTAWTLTTMSMTQLRCSSCHEACDGPSPRPRPKSSRI